MVARSMREQRAFGRKICLGNTANFRVTLIQWGTGAMMLGLMLFPDLASAQVIPDHSIAHLPDGDYFYGEAPVPAESDTGYFVFRKTGDQITGLFYQVTNKLHFCFQGTMAGKPYSSPAKVSTKQNSHVPPLPRASELGGLYQLPLDQLPPMMQQDFQACLL